MDVSLSELRELVMDREAWHSAVYGVARVGHDRATELNWTDLFLWSGTISPLTLVTLTFLKITVQIFCGMFVSLS